MDTAQFPPGVMLDDKYRIDQLLSVGGMGAVYVGTHTLLKKRVAIKVLRTELANAAGMVERFQREAVAASQIGHENIVTVTDMGKTQGGVAFLVMELLEGRNLAAAIKADGPLPIGVACDIACEILTGVAAAHRVGIVHRDLKPENVFLVRRAGRGEAVKILDFGISSLAGADKTEMRLTHTGLIMGTPNYMAPEQARGDKDITLGADVYSIGVILYEMLTQAIPYEAENYNLTVFRVLSGEYVKPRLRRPDLPPALEAVICKAMSLNAWDRYASAEEMIAALAPFGSGTASVPVVIPPATAAQRRISVVKGGSAEDAHSDTLAASASELVGAGTGNGAAKPRTRRWLAFAVIGAVAAGAATTMAIAMNGGTPKANQAPVESNTAHTPPGAAHTPPGAAPTAPNTAHTPPNTAQTPPNTAHTPPKPTPTPPSTAPTPPSTAPTPASPAPETITIQIQVDPSDAVIMVDGKPVKMGLISVPPSNAPMKIRVVAPGYHSFEGVVVPDKSKEIVLPPLEKKARGGDRSGDRGGKAGGGKIVTDNPYGD